MAPACGSATREPHAVAGVRVSLTRPNTGDAESSRSRAERRFRARRERPASAGWKPELAPEGHADVLDLDAMVRGLEHHAVPAPDDQAVALESERVDLLGGPGREVLHGAHPHLRSELAWKPAHGGPHLRADTSVAQVP